jgi:hypothetical protein
MELREWRERGFFGSVRGIVNNINLRVLECRFRSLEIEFSRSC